MNGNQKLPCTCLQCGTPTDAPFCEACERELHELTVEAADTEWAAHQRPAAHRAQKQQKTK